MKKTKKSNKFNQLVAKLKHNKYKKSSLDLSRKGLNDAQVLRLTKALGTNPEVATLNLAYNKLTDTSAMALNKIPTIRRLILAGNKKISNRTILACSENPNLQALDLGATNISNDGLAPLSGNKTLTHLDIRETKISSLKSLAETNLNSLNISGSKVDDKGIEFFATHNKSLLEFDASFTAITDDGIKHFFSNHILLNINTLGLYIKKNEIEEKLKETIEHNFLIWSKSVIGILQAYLYPVLTAQVFEYLVDKNESSLITSFFYEISLSIFSSPLQKTDLQKSASSSPREKNKIDVTPAITF